MTRAELIDRLAHRNGFSRDDASTAVEVILTGLKEALQQGDRIEIRGFGSFSLGMRKPRLARNPKTGKPVSVPAKRTVYFKAGKEMRERVDR